MKRLAVYVALVTAACSSAPISYEGMVPPARDNAYGCAVAHLHAMGYVITAADSGTGFVRARKYAGETWDRIIGNAPFDVLTATTIEQASGETLLTVSVSREVDRGGGGLDPVSPGESGRLDAHSLLQSCGVADAGVVSRT